MKVVKNTTHQGLSVCFTNPKGTEHVFIKPRSTVDVPDSWGGEILDNLIKRRMLKVSYTPDPDRRSFSRRGAERLHSRRKVKVGNTISE